MDDDPSVQRLMRRLLELLGCSVEAVGSGEECLRRLESDPPDLLILDLMLPGLDGAAVLQRLQARRLALPVLVLSAKDEIESLPGELAGASAYLTKPVHVAELVEVVNGLLGAALAGGGGGARAAHEEGPGGDTSG
ncbi:Alkaline phosphatase synthesis transcriptional regulatory protein PhoP [Calidithermus terrae]|uniref:Alkaline phosphatase synthesis transcriptional regulatory protein PhoP n=1 Tax=Calidithermus terrae TaxID=1408545 RepID=A0A399EEX8_9DEIN|nr:Alkaline phosphatase synthesis transcriptional regulatory protein PhoP [Calidithermus terrae]